MTMLNLIKPQYARQQIRQRRLYSVVAGACIALGANQLIMISNAQTSQTPNTAIATNEIKPVAPTSIEETEWVDETPDLCSTLAPPEVALSAIIWQQEGPKLSIKSPEQRFYTLIIGENIPNTSWQLQRIDKQKVIWFESEFSCHFEQGIEPAMKATFSTKNPNWLRQPP